MMVTWEVILTNRQTVTVNVPSNLPDYRQSYVAICSHPKAFSARPIGCNGIAYNAHCGLEQRCPIHRVPTIPEVIPNA